MIWSKRYATVNAEILRRQKREDTIKDKGKKKRYMRKKNGSRIGLWLCAICTLGMLSGCQRAVDYVPTQSSTEETVGYIEETKWMEETTLETEEEVEKVTEPQTVSNSSGYATLTMDIVRTLADKHEALTIQDLAPYMDVRVVTERNSPLRKEIEFTDGGVEYVLRVIASPKSEFDIYSNALDFVILFRKDYKTLGAEGEGEDLRHAGDIRSGNIDHIIQAKMVMSDYLTCVLPEGVREDIFEAGEYMGTRLMMGVGEDSRMIGSFCIETPHHRMRTNVVEEYEELALGSAVMQRTLEQIDMSERQLYIALITRENSSVQYRLYFDADFITEEDFLTVTESVEMEENAFY